jgi:hypothetical protein
MDNNFTLYMDNNIASPRKIRLSLTSGNLRTLQSITISIQTAPALKNDLQDLLSFFPSLQVFGIDGNLLRTIDFYRPLDCESETAIQRCVDQSFGLLLSAFGGKEHFREFMIRNPSLTLEYTFGVAVDLILPATGKLVKGEPQVSFSEDEMTSWLTSAVVAFG